MPSGISYFIQSKMINIMRNSVVEQSSMFSDLFVQRISANLGLTESELIIS